MSYSIRVRQGTNTERLANGGVMLAEGEPAYTTDAKGFYVGDGETPGGLAVLMASGLSGDYTIPDGDGTHYHHLTLASGIITGWTTDTNP